MDRENSVARSATTQDALDGDVYGYSEDRNVALHRTVLQLAPPLAATRATSTPRDHMAACSKKGLWSHRAHRGDQPPCLIADLSFHSPAVFAILGWGIDYSSGNGFLHHPSGRLKVKEMSKTIPGRDVLEYVR